MPTIGQFGRVTQNRVIATILSGMDAELAALEAKLAKARDLKQGMMQDLLTGRIRLVCAWWSSYLHAGCPAFRLHQRGPVNMPSERFKDSISIFVV